ncbi:MAG: excinuclease ABC subunit UvrC [Flavobacteriales bacterium]|nr:excinuclease ABC subunit UvrC [Flavobacteriales bacterium]
MDIADKIKLLPVKPGVYQFKDESGKIIYIGKARSLKSRVNSYFSKHGGHSGKTRVMIKRIADLSFIVVESELDALLLENSLIKKYQPRYNVMLKDDKTYPWLCIKNERFPRVFPTRTKIEDGSEYFGPYASVKMMKTLLKLIRQIYKIRTCKYDLSKSNIDKGKFKVCLEYHIGNCLGPCEGLQSHEDYASQIDQIKEIIKGNVTEVINRLEEIMKTYSENLAFEKAQDVKEKIDILSGYKSKSAVVNPAISNTDVFSVASDMVNAYVNYMRVVDGSVIQSHTMTFKKRLEENDAHIISLAIAEIQNMYQSLSKDILVTDLPEIELEGHRVSIPQRGDKKKLLELSMRNARYFMLDKQRQSKFADPEKHTTRILEQMKKDLRLSELPTHIECFDNSNFQGTDAVAACVVFKDARPSKKDYRHFNIKTVEGPDDFASMKEVVYRRYKRLSEAGESLPQLVVVDGGKGQLSSAVESLDELGLRGKIAIVGIAKKLEEIFYPGDSLPLFIDKKSETLKVLQHARNEAHRFGITHHRNKRSKSTIKSELTDIPGIGKTTSEQLLKTFQSVSRIKKASLGDLENAIGPAKAAVVRKWFDLEQ